MSPIIPDISSSFAGPAAQLCFHERSSLYFSVLICRAAGKIFVGGVAWETTEATLSAHFSSFGEVRACLSSACSAPPAYDADEAVCDREAPTAVT